ncbi:MAG: hypothetical protein JKX93_17360, partial [Rhizobiaceae bacterium]|nr:hypothetical protein [Rhizobiaceae bacterium]
NIQALAAPEAVEVDMDEFEKELEDQALAEEFNDEFQAILEQDIFTISSDCSDIISNEEFEEATSRHADNLNEEAFSSKGNVLIARASSIETLAA